MKNLYLYMCILLYGCLALAQKNDHWQLGKSDLDFSTNPNTVNTISTITGSNYGNASISDNNGDLLFYTDGKNVWNKNHAIMTNGTNITNYPESLQRAIIVPHPGDSNKYYIFRKAIEYCGCTPYAIEYGYYVYSIVDFSTNSLGELLNINPSPISGFENNYTKVLSDATPALNYSPLTSIKSYSGNFYWVLVQDGDRILSYKIDSSGLIDTPVISNFPSGTIYHIGFMNTITGNLKGISASMFRIASNGTISKLYGLESSSEYNNSADSADHRDNFYSLSFNDNTGALSNYQNIEIYLTNNFAVSYNFELSPDLQKAYFVQYRSPTLGSQTNDAIKGQIIVKDLANITTSPRLLYEFGSPSTRSSGFYAIQKDKYDNMLVSALSATANKNKYVHIINNPNSFSGSSIQLNYVSLNNNSISALPQIIFNSVVPCQGDILLTTTNTYTNYEYKSNSKITTNTNYVINSGSNIIFHAAQAIYLEPNTDIKSGSVFLAEIQNCDLPGMRIGVGMDNDQEEGVLINATSKLYPNPNNGSFEIALGKEITRDLLVEVFDIYGKTVYNGNAKTNRFAVNIPNLSTGMYIVRLSSGDYNETIKFIKQ